MEPRANGAEAPAPAPVEVPARLGLVLRNMPGDDVARLARQAEDSGFTDIFFPETGHAGSARVTGRDPFLSAATALRATSRLRAGPGVSVTLVRTPRAMALAAATAAEDSRGRFVLACGVSHRPAMERLNVRYPASALGHAEAYLAELRDLSRSQLAFGAGFPVLLGALGPKMLHVAATAADGVLLNWLTAETAGRVSGEFAAGARAAGNANPEIALYVRTGSRDALLAEAVQYRDDFPNYARHFARQGLASPAGIADATCTGTDPAAIAETMEAYRGAGITLPCLYPVGMQPDEISALLASLAGRACQLRGSDSNREPCG